MALPARALQDFPHHARLEEVCFRSRGNASLEELLREVSGLRTSCLSSVSTIRLEVRALMKRSEQIGRASCRERVFPVV